jgi:hypothetical protein
VEVELEVIQSRFGSGTGREVFEKKILELEVEGK